LLLTRQRPLEALLKRHVNHQPGWVVRLWFCRVGSIGIQAYKRGCPPRSCNLHEFSAYEAGGTGIEPATCGCGDPIRRVGGCRALSPQAGLPHSCCRLMPSTVARCRRSLGQILGQPILPRALFSQLSVSDPRTYPPDAFPDLADVPRRAIAFSAFYAAVNAQAEAPLTVPFCSVRPVCWRTFYSRLRLVYLAQLLQ
jgi:hypothetical protein